MSCPADTEDHLNLRVVKLALNCFVAYKIQWRMGTEYDTVWTLDEPLRIGPPGVMVKASDSQWLVLGLRCISGSIEMYH